VVIQYEEALYQVYAPLPLPYCVIMRGSGITWKRHCVSLF